MKSPRLKTWPGDERPAVPEFERVNRLVLLPTDPLVAVLRAEGYDLREENGAIVVEI